MPMENLSGKELLPQVNETIAEYLKSERYLKASKGIVISTPGEQEDSGRKFSAMITPLQRMELLNIMIRSVFADELSLPEHLRWENEIIITKS